MQHVGVQSLLKVHIKNKTFVGANGVRTQALKDAQLSLRENSFTVFFGPSGCGKSTLLRILAGLDMSFEGDLDWAHAPKIGMVFQEPRLLPWRTVRENIMLSADTSFTEAEFKELVEVMGLAELVLHYPGELSLGLSRRVAIARAFASKPNLLLLDEPFVSLDAPTAARLRQLVRTLWVDNPITAVMVTHDIREAVELGEEILLFTPRPGSIHERLQISPADRIDEASIEAKRAEIKARYPQLFEE